MTPPRVEAIGSSNGLGKLTASEVSEGMKLLRQGKKEAQVIEYLTAARAFRTTFGGATSEEVAAKVKQWQRGQKE